MPDDADWRRTFARVLDRLTGVDDYGNGRGRARCPVHGDAADLWLSVGDGGRLLVRCYPRSSGTPACRVDAVVRAVGAEMADLYPPHPDAGKPPARPAAGLNREGGVRNRPDGDRGVIESFHEYWDIGPDGKPFLSFEVIKKRFRDGSKDYSQRRPNPAFEPAIPASETNQEWIWKVAGHVRPVLYRLPELRAELKASPERWVLVVEGEKDAETAAELGLCATTSPGGAGKWRSEFAQELKGRNVLVVPDEDPLMPTDRNDLTEPWKSPGLEHARAVIKSLVGVANVVKLVRLPMPKAPGWDFSDWRAEQPGPADQVKKRFATVVNMGAVVEPQMLSRLDELLMAQTYPGVPTPPPPKADLFDRAGPAAPRPEDQTPASPPPPPVAVPPPTPAQPAVPAGAAITAAVAALGKASPGGPRSPAEWLGEVMVAFAGFQAAFGDGRFEAGRGRVREAAVLLAAHLAVGAEKFGG